LSLIFNLAVKNQTGIFNIKLFLHLFSYDTQFKYCYSEKDTVCLENLVISVVMNNTQLYK